MTIKWIMCIFFTVVTSISAFPYYVEPAILDEIDLNKARYEKQPTNNEVLFDLSMSYAYSGQILKGWTLLKKIPESYAETVVATYTDKMAQNPTEWRYPFKCAFGYFFKGEKQRAIGLFKEVIALEPEQVWAYGFIALIYGEMDDADTTIQWCKKGLEIEPNAIAIHFLLGEAYRRKKKYFKAFKQVLKVGRLEKKVAQ